MRRATREQELTNALLKLGRVGEQKVYVSAGHGEWPMDPASVGRDADASLGELRKQLLQEGYAPEVLNLAGKEEVPRDASLVVVAGPRSAFTFAEAQALRGYLAEGGRLLLFAEPNADVGLDLAGLLAEYGVELDPGCSRTTRRSTAARTSWCPRPCSTRSTSSTRPLKQRKLNVQFPTARGLTVLARAWPRA